MLCIDVIATKALVNQKCAFILTYQRRKESHQTYITANKKEQYNVYATSPYIHCQYRTTTVYREDRYIDITL